MPINTIALPPEAASEMEQAITRIASRPALSRAAPIVGRSAALASAARTTAPGAAPHLSAPVYTVELDAIATGRALRDTALLTLWGRLQPTDRGRFAIAEVLAQGFHFSALTEGPFVDELDQEVSRLRTDTTMANRSLDLAMLRIPALHLNAIWLRDQAGNADVLIPIGQVYPPLRAGQRYAPADLIQALQPEAARLMQTGSAQGG